MPRQERLPKRFYREVTVDRAEESDFAILLDGRSVRTPGRARLMVPHRHVAEAIAAEWQAQAEVIDPASMPMTRLSNTVIEGVAGDPEPIRADMVRYVETDLLFYRAEWPDALIERERAVWDPVLDWVRATYGAHFVLAEGVMHVSQPEAALAKVSDAVAGVRNPFEVAALHQVTSLTGSGLLALALRGGHLDAQGVWRAAHVDEDWNAERWGADEEAVARRHARWQEMEVASLILAPRST